MFLLFVFWSAATLNLFRYLVKSSFNWVTDAGIELIFLYKAEFAEWEHFLPWENRAYTVRCLDFDVDFCTRWYRSYKEMKYCYRNSCVDYAVLSSRWSGGRQQKTSLLHLVQEAPLLVSNISLHARDGHSYCLPNIPVNIKIINK